MATFIKYQLLMTLCVIIITNIVGEITILKAVQTIYDQTPKLRIKGSGFDAAESDILLNIAASSQSYLMINIDFMLTKDEYDEGIILKLLPTKR